MQPPWRRRLRVWFTLLAILALAWTVRLLWNAWPELVVSFSKLQAGWLWLTLAGTVAGGYLNFEAFHALFERSCHSRYDRLRLAHLHFTAQLMKHLPGRIWGVAYQSTTGDRATAAEWVGVTVAYMVLTTGFALWVAAIVLGYMFAWWWSVLALVTGGSAYLLIWRARPLAVLLGVSQKLPFHVFTRLGDAVRPLIAADPRFKLQVWGWFTAGWLVYLLAWAGYGLAWPDLTAADGIWLCAIYTVAWFVGYVSLFSPSGMGVRELVFVLLAHRFPPDAVAGMALLARVVLLVADVVLGVAFAPFRRVR